MKKHLSSIILVLVFLAGLSLLLYPTVSDYINCMSQTRAIANYVSEVAQLDQDDLTEMWDAAVSYNERLAARGGNLVLTEAQREEYENTLCVQGGAMSYVEIPSINCMLPIYHGTGDDVLQVAVGHLEGSSLPVGGESTHCVLSGHRGLPSARLFTDLDQLTVGDIFRLYTLGKTLTYEVDQILIVEPNDTEALKIVPGMDYCTLVTCTPYGVNTHRLLVRGHRVDDAAASSSLMVTADALQIEPTLVAPFAAIPIMIVMVAAVFYAGHRRSALKKKKLRLKLLNGKKEGEKP